MKSNDKFSWEIFGGIFIVVILSVAGVLFWQRNNIAALTYYLGNSEEELELKMRENERKTVEAMEKLPSRSIIKDLSDEEKSKLAANEITEIEAVQIILDKSAKPLPTATVSQDFSETKTATEPAKFTPAATPPTAAEPDPGVIIAGIIAEIYVLRAHYTNALEEMRLAAIAEFAALKPEQQTNAAKQNIGLKYMQRAGNLESECDAKMDGVIARLEKELKNSAGDLSLINDVRNTYANEKSLMKAYYMNMYR